MLAQGRHWTSLCKLSIKKTFWVLKLLLDVYLKSYSKTCPEIVLDLLMLEREINRNQFNTLNKDSVWNILENAKKNIDDINEYQKKLMGILLLETSIPLSDAVATTQCKNLKKFIEEMRLRKTN